MWLYYMEIPAGQTAYGNTRYRVPVWNKLASECVVFDRCYDAGPYRREIQYGVDPVVPPLSEEQARWAAGLLPAAGAGE